MDDEQDIVALVSEGRKTFGYRVLTAWNGAEVLTVYFANMSEISVVLTDMTMPVMDGATMIHALREMNPAVKVIAASGLGVNTNSTPSVKHFLANSYGVKPLLAPARRIMDED